MLPYLELKRACERVHTAFMAAVSDPSVGPTGPNVGSSIHEALQYRQSGILGLTELPGSVWPRNRCMVKLTI